MNTDKTPGFDVRALELHSLYAWDYNWIIQAMDFMQKVNMNTLILHRNDFIDLIVYPGKYFGYERKSDDTIFETYSHIFRKLYQYTPTRRSGPYQRRAFLKRVLEQAERRKIKVYIENKELYFPDILLEFYPNLVKDGHICASDPFWIEFLKIKYHEFFQEFPQVEGIITAIATGESRVSIKSNRCQCERCQALKKEEWFDQILRAMYEPIHKAGKTLVVRDFVFDPQAHKEIACVMEQLPEDVVISLKNTPHDYYPTFPDNSRIGHVGSHRQWVEFDAMGQYFGWGIAIADMTSDYRRRMQYAWEQGAEGIIIRTDWESLDGHSAFLTPNKVNLYSSAILAEDLTVSDELIYETYLDSEGWFQNGHTKEQRAEGVDWLKKTFGRTWDVTSRILYVQDCVCSDSSLMPVSYEHAFWLMEEKNSLKVWDVMKEHVLDAKEEYLENALKEKEEALEILKEIQNTAMKKIPVIQEEKRVWLKHRIDLHLSFAEMYVSAVKAILLTRYITETDEDRTSRYYFNKRQQWEETMDILLKWEQEIRQMFRETDEMPHTVYTLMDADRIRCLYHNLEEKGRKGAEWSQ